MGIFGKIFGTALGSIGSQLLPVIGIDGGQVGGLLGGLCRAIAGIIPGTLYRILYTPLMRIPDRMNRINDTRYKAIYKLIYHN